MEHLYYVRRAKSKLGLKRHKRLHAADNTKTFCGKELNEMWFIEPQYNMAPEDVSCAPCRYRLSANKRLGGDVVCRLPQPLLEKK